MTNQCSVLSQTIIKATAAEVDERSFSTAVEKARVSMASHLSKAMSADREDREQRR